MFRQNGRKNDNPAKGGVWLFTHFFLLSHQKWHEEKKKKLEDKVKIQSKIPFNRFHIENVIKCVQCIQVPI